MAEQRNQTPAGDNTQWTTIIRPRTGWFDVDLEELWRYRDLIVMFVKRNFPSCTSRPSWGRCGSS